MSRVYNAEILSVGTEIEISNNFIFPDAQKKYFFVNPTIALKYTF